MMNHDALSPTLSAMNMASMDMSSMNMVQDGAALGGYEGVLVTLFLVGLAGGASHCIGMCGPFVLSQVQARMQAVSARDMSEFKRLTGSALVPYHLGRLTTYSVLGGAVALVSRQVMKIPQLSVLAALLLGVAAVFFFGYALRSLGVAVPWRGRAKPAHDCAAKGVAQGAGAPRGQWARGWGNLMRPLFAHPVGWRGYVLGVALGFIPCGMVYGALAAAAATGYWLSGMLAMAAFALGTMPALFGFGLAGHAVLGRWPNVARRVAPALLIVNGGFLLYLAGRLV